MRKAAPFTKTLLITSLILLTHGCSEPKKGLPYAIDVDETHVGRIKADTPYDASQIAALMPGFDIEPFTSFIAGEPHSVLHLTYHEQPVLTITPTKEGTRIASVSIHSPEVTAQGKFNIGKAFHNIFSSTDPCSVEKQGASERLSCQAPDSHHIFYLFTTDTPVEKAQNNESTSYAWPVETILWKPDA